MYSGAGEVPLEPDSQSLSPFWFASLLGVPLREGEPRWLLERHQTMNQWALTSLHLTADCRTVSSKWSNTLVTLLKIQPRQSFNNYHRANTMFIIFMAKDSHGNVITAISIEDKKYFYSLWTSQQVHSRVRQIKTRARSQTLQVSVSMLTVKVHDSTKRKRPIKYGLFGRVARES